MKKNRKWFLAFSALFFAHGVSAEEKAAQAPIRLISLSGGVSVNGKPASMGQTVALGSSMECSKGGTAVLQVGNDNIVKVTPGSKLAIVTANSGLLGIRLQAGRIEGVNRVSDSPKQNAQISTANASLDVPGGRYIVQVDEKSEQFYSMDLPAPLTQANGTEQKTTTISAGQGVMVSSQPAETNSRSPASGPRPMNIPNPVPLTQTPKMEISSAVPVPPMPPRGGTSGFQSIAVDPVMGTSPSINRDPVQSIGRANVSVEFRY